MSKTYFSDCDTLEASPPMTCASRSRCSAGRSGALEHVAAGRGISFLGRSATVFYSHPEVGYVPVTDLAPDQVCLAVAASRNSPLVDDFLTAAQATSDITAECGNHEMWQLGGSSVAKDGTPAA